LVGQAPSRRSDGKEAFPKGARSAKRLSTLIGGDVRRLFDAENLLDRWPGKAGKGDSFPIEIARKKAIELLETDRHDILILFGRKVAEAFGLGDARWFEERRIGRRSLYAVPHPSGINLWWNDRTNVEKARRFFEEVAREGNGNVYCGNEA